MIIPRLSFAALIMLVTLAVLPSPASAAWSRCANEGGTCNISGQGHHLVRYGGDGSFFYLETDGGFTDIHCDGDVFGDPAYGHDKACEYTTLDPVSSSTRWTRCAGENEDCNIPGGQPHLVKYASSRDGRAVYRVGSNTVPCKNSYFTDVDKGGTKSCSYASDVYGEITIKSGIPSRQLSFVDCASEDQPCAFAQDVDAALIRFGSGDKWVYRLASTSQVPCANGTFGWDPARGDDKFCQYAYVPARITGLTGTWVKVGTCANCDSLVHSVTVGLQGSRANTSSKTWSNEVFFEVEKKFGPGSLLGDGGGIKGGFKASWGGTESVETTVSRSVATTKQATCSAPNKRITMWQWSMDVSDECYALEGKCKSTISAFDILCTADPIPAGFAPACLPGQPTSQDVSACAPLSKN
jgi:hypothetical protein